MAKIKASPPNSQRKVRPALTPEAREQQMIGYAIDLAEQQLRDGTASSQVITHFLKLGTMKAELEKEKLQEENKLLRAKTEAIENGKNYNELVQKAIDAMKNYQGLGDPEDYDIY